MTTQHMAPANGIIERFAQYLDVDDDTPRITLGEGNTPLLRAKRLGAEIGIHIHLKLELCNPTGSFKDRGMCMAVARAVQAGCHTLICASTGNTSASAAAFASAAGLRCVVVIPEGKIAFGKLVQAQVAGAVVLAVNGNFDEALVAVRQLAAADPGIELVNSVNPYRIEGQKTGAYEVVNQLGGRTPDWLCIPVGNAGNITAYWRGFRELHERGEIAELPRMLGTQAAGAAPLVDGAPVENPETIATAIRIGRPARGEQALEAVAQSKGALLKRSDEQLLAAQSMIATQAGVFCEPASAASLAGLLAHREAGEIADGATAVCVLTGHGLKDTDAVRDQLKPVVACDPTAMGMKSALDSLERH